MALREGKNREVRRVLEHLGLQVTRLIRLSYGPFQLGHLARGAVDEVPKKVLAEQLGKPSPRLRRRAQAASGGARMRIVAGSHRGRRLLAPPGETVRPTSDRAREALFNILSHGQLAAGGVPFADAAVLDAFAGTGALGLEALSRGAAAAMFIEQDREALAVLRKNIAALGEGARAQIVPGDATRPPRAMARCAVAFLDPPYRSGLAAPALAALDAAGWLAPRGPRRRRDRGARGTGAARRV